MKLMTWNIRLGIQRGLDPIAEVVRSHSPDVVALQEVGRHWVMGPPGDTTRELARRAGLPHRYFVPSLSWYPPAQYGHTLLSRFPIASSTTFWLPRSVDEQRTWLEAEIVVDGSEVTFVTTHLSHVGDRPAQGEALVDRLLELDRASRHFILMGDLNEDELATSWLARLSGFAAPAPAKSPTFPADAPKARIDWIWSNFGEWSSAQVVETTDESDHRPVVAELNG